MPTLSTSSEIIGCSVTPSRRPNSPDDFGEGRLESSATPSSRPWAKKCAPPLAPSSSWNSFGPDWARAVPADSPSANPSAAAPKTTFLAKVYAMVPGTIYECRVAKKILPSENHRHFPGAGSSTRTTAGPGATAQLAEGEGQGIIVPRRSSTI